MFKKMLKGVLGTNFVTKEEIQRFEEEKQQYLEDKMKMEERIRLARAELTVFKKTQSDFRQMMNSFNAEEALKNGAAVEMMTKEEFETAIREDAEKLATAERMEEEAYYSFARNVAIGYFSNNVEMIQEALYSNKKSKSVCILLEIKKTKERIILLVDNINLETISYEFKQFKTEEDWQEVVKLRGWFK